MAVVIMVKLLNNFRFSILISDKYLCLINASWENLRVMIESNFGFGNKET